MPIVEGLGLPLTVVYARKLTAPIAPELAFGALDEDGEVIIEAETVEALGLQPADIDRAKARVAAEIKRRMALYRVPPLAHYLPGAHVVLVDDGLATGSTIYAARPVASGVGIEHVLASELEVDGGKFTGRASTLCFGRHKVALAEKWAQRHGIDLGKSYFYSDSFNDLPLLERVGTAIAINPDARLARHARRRGWAIAQWS